MAVFDIDFGEIAAVTQRAVDRRTEQAVIEVVEPHAAAGLTDRRIERPTTVTLRRK